MHTIYNVLLLTTEVLLGLLCRLLSADSKVRKLGEGQRHLLDKIEKELSGKKREKLVWVHAASLGEYGVARPIIRQLREKCGCTVVLTFFSSTGYEALHDHHPDVDEVFYLPLDTPKNASRFLDILQPERAVFIISEFWPNYLFQLKKRGIPTFLISALITERSPLFRWYGRLLRQSLQAFTRFMVLDEGSRANLQKLGFENLSVTGDPLFDNAIAVASTPWQNVVIEHFAAQGDLFIAGSISDSKDLELVCALARKHREVHFVFVPHEINEDMLSDIEGRLEGSFCRYSACDEHTDFAGVQVLIIDTLGSLAYLYRYGKWAYVGGGFTPYLHSIIEATVYGLPVAFGPKIHRKVTPKQLVERGIGCIVTSADELDQWFTLLKNNEAELKKIRETAETYARQNSGATDRIIRLIRQS